MYVKRSHPIFHCKRLKNLIRFPQPTTPLMRLFKFFLKKFSFKIFIITILFSLFILFNIILNIFYLPSRSLQGFQESLVLDSGPLTLRGGYPHEDDN